MESGGGSASGEGGEGDNGAPRKALTAQPQSLFANRWPRRVGLTVMADSAIPGASSSRHVPSGMIWFEDQNKRYVERKKGRVNLTISELGVSPSAWVPPSMTLDGNISGWICRQ